MPLDDTQVKLILQNKTDSVGVQRVMAEPELLDLMRRPVMSELGLDDLQRLPTGQQST